MAEQPNVFNLLWFDPGSAATGWAHFQIDARCFARPERKITPYIIKWQCGEITGDDHEQYTKATAMAYGAHFNPPPYVARCVIGSEGHILKQTIGSADNLLSPVRFNAVLSWEIAKHGLELVIQNPGERGQITAERLELFGFRGWPKGRWVKCGKGKDAFAAMQHAVLRLKRIRVDTKRVPWKMSDEQSSNAWWDCDCEDGKPCDISHPA